MTEKKTEKGERLGNLPRRVQGLGTNDSTMTLTGHGEPWPTRPFPLTAIMSLLLSWGEQVHGAFCNPTPLPHQHRSCHYHLTQLLVTNRFTRPSLPMTQDKASWKHYHTPVFCPAFTGSLGLGCFYPLPTLDLVTSPSFRAKHFTWH